VQRFDRNALIGASLITGGGILLIIGAVALPWIHASLGSLDLSSKGLSPIEGIFNGPSHSGGNITILVLGVFLIAAGIVLAFRPTRWAAFVTLAFTGCAVGVAVYHIVTMRRTNSDLSILARELQLKQSLAIGLGIYIVLAGAAAAIIGAALAMLPRSGRRRAARA
jgi:hypothetical protein